MKRIISIILTLSAFALLLASCGKEPMLGRRDAQAIKLTVKGVMDTKASVVTTSTLSSFYLSAYATRSWRKDSVGQSTPLHDPGLYVDPVGGALEGIHVSKGTSGWTIAGNEDESSPAFSWINDVTMNFFAYAPSADDTDADAAKGSLAITKAIDGTTSTTANFPFTYAAKVTSGTVASGDCDDLIFAYASNKVTYESDNTSSDFGNKTSGEEYINLKFYHALAQVRFCVSTNDGTFDPSIKLKSITLKGVSSAGMVTNGSCVFDGSASTFGWTLGSTKANYTQTFNGTNGVSFGATAPTGWTPGSYTDSGSNTFNLYTCTGDVLFLIPQDPKNCVVDITLNVGGTDTTITGKLQAVSSTNSSKIWEAGKVYTYKVKAGKNGGLDLLPDGWSNGGGNINI